MDKVSIILRSKNEERFIGRTLENLFDQQVTVDLEIIIVDSGSTDKTIEIAKQYPTRVFSIPADSFSYGYALNYGIERTEGSVICSLSAHCLPADVKWMDYLLEPILRGGADASYGRQLPFKRKNVWEEFHADKLFPGEGKTPERVAFSNANCAFRKSLWEKKKFDEELPRWEDYLWYLQLKDQHEFVYRPKAAVYHSHDFSLAGYADMCRKDGEAHALFKTRHGIALPRPEKFFGKAKMVFLDMAAHAEFFMKEKYFKELFMIPAVKTAGYWAYFEGSRRDAKRSFRKQCAANLKL